MIYANQYGYSDVYPYEIVRKISDKTIEIREMNAELVPTWKPTFLIGGFAGHCTNNYEQEYVYTSNKNNIVIRARLQKNGTWKSVMGKHRIEEKPKRFYDYNF